MKKKTFIPIPALVGALLLTVIAAMTSFVAGPNLAYAQVDSDVATLSALRVSSGTLTPTFDPNMLLGDGGENTPHVYRVNVPHAVESLTVSTTRTDSNSTVAYSGGVGSTSRMDLQPGSETALDITVTAENGSTLRYYRVTVTRAGSGASSNATLSDLTVIPGMETSPEALGTKFEYSVYLPYSDGTVAIAATPSVPLTDGTVVTYKKGDEVIPTTGLGTVAIDEGDNTITVEVMPPSYVAAHKKTYTLTINRARRNASDDARLSSLSLSAGALMPAFDPAALPGCRRRHNE